MNTHTALIVDDEPDIRDLLDITLSRMGIHSNLAANLKEAHSLLERQAFDLCLTDMRLPDGNGIDLVKHIQAHHPELPCAVITAHGSVDIAIDAMKAGAFDFLSKPLDLERLRALIGSAIRLSEPRPKGEDPLIGETGAMRQLKQQIQKLARSQAPVLISGESGSGKELIARAIHAQGPRAKKPFIAVNCGAIPRELMESEFFGHKKGSFTGAQGDKQGLFQAADGGTLFLDEVADLPLDMQVKLLRAIQEKAVRPVGSAQEVPVDMRILSASHKNLDAEVQQHRFRQDLYYRINVIQVQAPPLRERMADLPLLIDKILDKLARESGLPNAKLAPQALALLHRHDFPGNVRELENILERAYTLCDNDLITEHELQLKARPVHLGEPGSNHEMHGQSLDNFLEEIEKDAILNALEACRWNRTEAARKLGISFRSLRYRLKKLGLDNDE